MEGSQCIDSKHESTDFRSKRAYALHLDVGKMDRTTYNTVIENPQITATLTARTPWLSLMLFSNGSSPVTELMRVLRTAEVS